MTMQAEQVENSKAADDSAPPSNRELFRMLARLKLRLIANYILDGIVPAVAVIALIVAVMAIKNNASSHAQLGQNAASIASLSASLAASRSELEKLKSAMAQDKSMRETDNKKQDERMAKVVQNINQLQVKMKITPTLTEQLQQPASASAVAPQTIGLAAVSAVAPTAKGADMKPASAGHVLTQAIENFNQKKHK